MQEGAGINEMPRFDEMSKEELAEITSKGGKARAEALDEAKELFDKDFEKVVKDNTSNYILKELYDALVKSGKKGNVKAIETILKYLEKGKEEKPTTLEDFIDEV